MRSFISGVVVGAFGATLVIGGFAVNFWLHKFASAEPLPALIRDMPATVDQITPAFADRVEARFPVGTAERTLVAELRSEDFEPRWNLEDGTRMAVFVRSSPVCREEWRIFWKTDDKAVIATIRAQYASICL